MDLKKPFLLVVIFLSINFAILKISDINKDKSSRNEMVEISQPHTKEFTPQEYHDKKGTFFKL